LEQTRPFFPDGFSFSLPLPGGRPVSFLTEMYAFLMFFFFALTEQFLYQKVASLHAESMERMSYFLPPFDFSYPEMF